MGMHRMKIKYENLMTQIEEVLNADDIEYVHENAFGIATGLEISCGHLIELGQHAIDTNDEFLQQWCLDMGILKEDD